MEKKKIAKAVDNLKIIEDNKEKIENFESTMKWSEFKLNSDGMIPVIVQDYENNEVLMLAYMNEEAYNLTATTGRMTYYSRSRDEIWVKGLTSGHFQYVKSLTMDCDVDTMLAKVSQVGAACHTGSRSCFFHKLMERDIEENPIDYQGEESLSGEQKV